MWIIIAAHFYNVKTDTRSAMIHKANATVRAVVD